MKTFNLARCDTKRRAKLLCQLVDAISQTFGPEGEEMHTPEDLLEDKSDILGLERLWNSLS